MKKQTLPTIDEHAHTILSDGLVSPRELVSAAAALGLKRLAITDHDGLDAHLDPGVRRAAEAAGLVLTPGVEIDCELGDLHVEVLGFDFDPARGGLAERLRVTQAARRESVQMLAERLLASGEKLDARLLPGPETVAPLKVHLFRALTRAGRVYPGGYREFKAHLASLGPIPLLPVPTAAEAVELIVAAGGYAVLAHPLYYLDRIAPGDLLRRARDAGCIGIEFLYPYDFGPGAEGYLRFSYATSRERMEEGLKRLEGYLKNA